MPKNANPRTLAFGLDFRPFWPQHAPPNSNCWPRPW